MCVFWIALLGLLVVALFLLILPFIGHNLVNLVNICKIMVLSMGLVGSSLLVYKHTGAYTDVRDQIMIQRIRHVLIDLKSADQLSRQDVKAALKRVESQLPNSAAPWEYLAGIYFYLGFIPEAEAAAKHSGVTHK